LEFDEKEVTVLFTDNDEIQELNEAFRKKNKPTDVLSFPMPDDDYLGDMVISVEKAESQSITFECSLQEELVRLLIHGFLHLNGLDHVGVPRNEAAKMRRIEKKLMQDFKEKWPTWL